MISCSYLVSIPGRRLSILHALSICGFALTTALCDPGYCADRTGLYSWKVDSYLSRLLAWLLGKLEVVVGEVHFCGIAEECRPSLRRQPQWQQRQQRRH